MRAENFSSITCMRVWIASIPVKCVKRGRAIKLNMSVLLVLCHVEKSLEYFNWVDLGSFIQMQAIYISLKILWQKYAICILCWWYKYNDHNGTNISSKVKSALPLNLSLNLKNTSNSTTKNLAYLTYQNQTNYTLTISKRFSIMVCLCRRPLAADHAPRGCDI